MAETRTRPRPYGHDAPDQVFETPKPLVEVPEVRERSAAEEARTIAAGNAYGSLATLSKEGDPWSSMVAFALLDDGSPVLCVSTLAAHGRYLRDDPRASLMISQREVDGDPLAHGRVTLSGVAELAAGELGDAARAAYVERIPAADLYAGFGDFSIWVLRVNRVRWVGGYGRMDSASPDSYRSAEPDPTGPVAFEAIRTLNAERAEMLRAIVAELGGHPDVTAARCSNLDRYGLWFEIETPRGSGPARVGFPEALSSAAELMPAVAELGRRAQAA